MKISIEFCIFELIQVLNYSFNKNFELRNKFSKKGYFRSKTGDINITIDSSYLNQFLYKFSAQTDHFDFLDQVSPKRVVQKGCFQSKTDKMDTTIEFCVFELVFVSNFTLNKQLWIFGQNLPRKSFSRLKQKK